MNFFNAGRSKRARLWLAALLAAVAAPAVAHAELVVLSSSTALVKSGAVLPDSASLEVPAGARVRVMLPSGRTQEIKGPAKSKVADISKGEARNEGLWNDVVNVISRQKKADESVVGAVRSVAPPSGTRGVAAPASAKSFSWRIVPLDPGGDVCVEKGVALELLRTKPGKPMSVVIVNRQDQRRGEATFAVGSATAKWPVSAGTDVGMYAVSFPDGPPRTIRLRPIAPLPAADETLRVLHSQRCLAQIEAWLAGIAVAGR